jgi:urease accessory protein
MVLPGPTGAVSSYRLDVDVEAGGHLTFLPEPQILVRGCDHEMRTTIRLGPRATLRWRDETVLGRHEEATGSLLHRVRIDRGDAPVLRSDLAVGPRWPESLGPGGIDGARAVGTLVTTVGATEDPTPMQPEGVGRGVQQPTPSGCDGDGVRAAWLELSDGTIVRSAVGATARGVRHALDGPFVHT